MITLMDTLRADYLAYRKDRKEVEIGLLSALIGEAERIGKDNGNRETTDAEAIQVIKKFLANGREVLGLVHSDELRNQALKENAILESYLPAQMDESGLRAAVSAFLEASPDAKIGDVMGHLKANFGGTYDGKLASQVVREALS